MLCPHPGHTAGVVLMAIPMQSWPCLHAPLCVCCMQHVLCVHVQRYLPLPHEGPCCLAVPSHCESLYAAGTTAHPETLRWALFSPQLVTCQDGRAGGLL